MKYKRFHKVIAMLLTAVMLTSSMPAYAINAEDSSELETQTVEIDAEETEKVSQESGLIEQALTATSGNATITVTGMLPRGGYFRQNPLMLKSVAQRSSLHSTLQFMMQMV